MRSPVLDTATQSTGTVPSLLRAGPDWWNNACVGFANCEWDLYARGYKRAADLLVSHIGASGSDQDVLVYPILFMYRQYFELRLKQLMRDAAVLLDEEFKLPGTHALTPLYVRLVEKLNVIHENVGGDSINAKEFVEAEQTIRAIDEVDPQSMTFRYPTTLNGNRLVPDVDYINLRVFREGIERLASLLEGIDCQLSALADIRNDWMRDQMYNH